MSDNWYAKLHRITRRLQVLTRLIGVSLVEKAVSASWVRSRLRQSTLMNIFGALGYLLQLVQTRGRPRVARSPTTTLEIRATRLESFVFQSFGLLPRATVLHERYVAAHLHSDIPAKERVAGEGARSVDSLPEEYYEHRSAPKLSEVRCSARSYCSVRW